MGFISKNNGVVRDEFEQGGGRLPRCASGEVAGVVLDPVADPGRFQHFEIKICPLFKALCFEQFTVSNQLIKPHAEFFFDPNNGLLHCRFGRHVVRVRINADFFKRVGLLPR